MCVSMNVHVSPATSPNQACPTISSPIRGSRPHVHTAPNTGQQGCLACPFCVHRVVAAGSPWAWVWPPSAPLCSPRSLGKNCLLGAVGEFVVSDSSGGEGTSCSPPGLRHHVGP